jgi:hypothetical protein
MNFGRSAPMHMTSPQPLLPYGTKVNRMFLFTWAGRRRLFPRLTWTLLRRAEPYLLGTVPLEHFEFRSFRFSSAPVSALACRFPASQTKALQNTDFRCGGIHFPDNGLFMSESMKKPLLDLPDERSAPPELLDSQVQRAQEQLLQLKRQQELIEKQKRELEELSRKQDELEKGRADMIEKLSRSLVVIERETYEAEKRVEQLRTTNATFAQHLDTLESINPKNWSNSDLHKELSKALSAVDDARAEYTKSLTKINAKSDGEVIIDPRSTGEETYYSAPDDASFVQWLKRGFAFTLPLLILGLSALLVFYFMHG